MLYLHFTGGHTNQNARCIRQQTSIHVYIYVCVLTTINRVLIVGCGVQNMQTNLVLIANWFPRNPPLVLIASAFPRCRVPGTTHIWFLILMGFIVIAYSSHFILITSSVSPREGAQPMFRSGYKCIAS